MSSEHCPMCWMERERARIERESRYVTAARVAGGVALVAGAVAPIPWLMSLAFAVLAVLWGWHRELRRRALELIPPVLARPDDTVGTAYREAGADAPCVKHPNARN